MRITTLANPSLGDTNALDLLFGFDSTAAFKAGWANENKSVVLSPNY